MSLRSLVVAAAAVCACAPAMGVRGSTPCVDRCTLELTNGTTLDLDVRVAQPSVSATVDEHLGPGESREIALSSFETPTITVVGARATSMTSRLNVRVQCTRPTRSRDTFRSGCRLASVSAVPGDSARGQPQRQVQ